MIDSVMGYSGAQFMQAYSITLTKKSMDTHEQAVTNLLQDMLPQNPAPVPAKGQYIDIYA